VDGVALAQVVEGAVERPREPGIAQVDPGRAGGHRWLEPEVRPQDPGCINEARGRVRA
jgi:hypothetical protein